MSSFVWMKVLESAPERYDRGVRLLSGGRIEAIYERIAELAAGPGKKVLDLGCGTGAVALACAARGAQVTGLDLNAEMLEVARGKPVSPQGSVTWIEAGVAEIGDHFEEASLDAVVSCLLFSELSSAAQDYTLAMTCSRLKPGGLLVIADEALPARGWRRLWVRTRRLPLIAATYLLTQTSTRAISDLEALGERMRQSGFVEVTWERLWGGTFAILRAHRPPAPRAKRS